MQNLTVVCRSRTLLLKVEGHSVTAAMKDGEFIKSRRWAAGDHDWEIHLRPKDHWAGHHRPITLKLVLVSCGGDVKAKVSCRLVDPTGKLVPSAEKSVSHNFHGPGSYSGPAVLMAREELEASGYLNDDAYTVECIITVLRQAPPAEDRPEETAAEQSPDLHRHLGELRRKGMGADVTFVVGRGGGRSSFAAHRAVLAARSPVFAAALFGGMKEEAAPLVEVEDMDAAAFEALLHFVYTDTAPELDRHEDGEDDAVAAMAQHLLAGADRYGLDRLKLICEAKLSDRVTVDTAATTLALAEQHGCSRLKAKCVDFIAGHLDAVLETEGYNHLEASCPAVLTKLLKAAHGGNK